MSGHIRVDVLDVVGVVNGDLAVAGQALGGRRARVALVALALAGQQLSADRLASIIWGDDLPATWQVALRGVVRGLRSAAGSSSSSPPRRPAIVSLPASRSTSTSQPRRYAKPAT
jgi:DNA-binding SARP family transcriptional activator